MGAPKPTGAARSPWLSWSLGYQVASTAQGLDGQGAVPLSQTGHLTAREAQQAHCTGAALQKPDNA